MEEKIFITSSDKDVSKTSVKRQKRQESTISTSMKMKRQAKRHP